MQPTDEGQALTQVTERVRHRFPDVDVETIGTVVAQYHREYDGRPIRAFVPVLVERDTVEHLRGFPRQPTAEDR